MSEKVETNLLGDHLCRRCGKPCQCCQPEHCIRCSDCYVKGREVKFWRLSERNGETVLDDRNAVVTGRALLETAKYLDGEVDRLAALKGQEKKMGDKLDEILDMPEIDLAALDTEIEMAFSEEVENYIRSLDWGDRVPDDVQTLVAGNIRGYAHRERINGPINQFVDHLVKKYAELAALTQNHWHAIEDGLPTDPGVYDVTFEPGYSTPFVKAVAFYDGKFYHGFDFEPIAWRERPKPYNGKAGGGKEGV